MSDKKGEMINKTGCPVCQGLEVEQFIMMGQVPVHCNLLWPTYEGAIRAPRGDIRLAFCLQCNHVFNQSFDPALMEYTQDYDNSLHFSPRFQQYALSVATRLIERYDLRDKDIVEIGSGKGDFLIMICELGNNRGVGFDPSHVPDGETKTTVPVNFVLDFYSEIYTDYPADFIVCRHVLEHIQQPNAFIDMVRQAVNTRIQTIVFFEVPNVLFTLRDLGIWDIIYEHCSYFSPYSLAQVFRNNEFRILNVEKTFGDQFLTIEAALLNGKADLWTEDSSDKQQLTKDVHAFTWNYREKVTFWQNRLQEMAGVGQKVVVWGAGSKGVTFMNVLNAHRSIKYIVDINLRKQGMYVAGTGQQIVPPQFLQTYQPDAVIIMNGNYKEEIGKTLADLGLSAEIMLA